MAFSKGLRGFFGGFRACGTLEELRDSLEGAFDPWWILKTRFESFGSASEVKDSCAKEPEALQGFSTTLEEPEGFFGQGSLTFEVVPEGLNRDRRIHQRNQKHHPENLIVLQRVPQGLNF